MHHAWLIIAHNEFGILQRLVEALDQPECSIFIHFDKKVKVLPSVLVKDAHLTILTERVDVRWGSVSQIRCELSLLEVAMNQGPFDYYHIISGTTLPLVQWKQLEDYFEGHRGVCILTSIEKDVPYQETLKVRRKNLFLKNYAVSGIRGKISQFCWKAAISLQRIIKFEVNKGKGFYKSSNWLSLSQEATSYLLSHKQEIINTYRHSFCGDEYFVPSELMASSLRDRLVCDSHYLLHNIGRSNAGVFNLEDLPELQNSGYLFARKFSAR